MKKNFLKYILFSWAALLLFLFAFRPDAAGARQVFGKNLRQVNAPVPVHIKNGDFESPLVTGTFRDVPAANSEGGGEKISGWEILNYQTTNGINDKTVRLFKDNVNHSEYGPGKQYTQLGGDVQAYLFQKFDTAPGNRLCYSFYYRKKSTDVAGRLAFFIGNSYNRENLVPIEVIDVENSDSWDLYRGVYEVPQGQYKTEIGFAPAQGRQNGVSFIDSVSVKTGACIVMKKESDKDSSGYVMPGDIIEYSLYFKNFGQIAAAELNIEDSIDPHLEFLGITDIESPVLLNTYFNREKSSLFITAAAETSLEGIDENNAGPIVKISYKVKVKDSAGASGYAIQSQATASYTDAGYSNYSGSIKAYSDIHVLAVPHAVATSSVTVSKRWLNADGNIPESIEVMLYKDGVPFGDPVVLSELNAWTYTWYGLDTEDVYKGDDGSARVGSLRTAVSSSSVFTATPSGSVKRATASSASSSYDDLEIYPEGKAHRKVKYTVKELDVPKNFTASEKEVLSNFWIIENKYTRPAKDPLENELDGKNKNPNIPPKDPSYSPDKNGSNSKIGSSDNQNGQSRYLKSYYATKTLPKNNNSENILKGTTGVSITKNVLSDPEKTESGADIEYELVLKNRGNETVYGIWIRDYVPDFTHFSSADESGVYGCVNGREFVSWFIEKLEPGQEIRLEFKAAKDYCVAGSITDKLYYEILNTHKEPYMNRDKDPAFKF
ncbi:Cna B-type domain-containing protein [Johnsonella ignava]|uniref:Cna B-type domain-containing protein n=1 Tax=Johnsonella ignava TaxID=43995 RepID=UPI0023F50E3D|nr:Cna B-type domain-containing protein [Johnsonella ignava]